MEKTKPKNTALIQKLLYTLLALLGLINLKAQVNLVPNGSFEDIDTCYFSFDQFSIVYKWFSPNNSTPDIYNSCAQVPGSGVPNNFVGYQHPADGNGYCGIVIFSPSVFNYREYIAVRLKDSLKAGINYCLKLNISLSETYPKHISSIGAHLSPDSIHQDDFKLLPLIPQLQNTDDNFITDTSSWMLIKDNYWASGGEKYIYIGNFRNDANTIVDSASAGFRTYVYIDNVQLYECDSLIGIKEEPVVPIKIYPNPATNTVSISLPANYPNPQLYIYNLTGQLVATKPIQPNQPVPITELNAGMYIFSIQSNNTLIGREKVVVY